MSNINTSLSTISEEINKVKKVLSCTEDILTASQDVESEDVRKELINDSIILISEARKQLGDDDNI